MQEISGLEENCLQHGVIPALDAGIQQYEIARSIRNKVSSEPGNDRCGECGNDKGGMPGMTVGRHLKGDEYMKKRILFTKLTLLCVGLLFFASCSDLLGFQEGTSSARNGGNGKVIFNGSICVTGALPSSLNEICHAELDSASINSSSRSALPSFTIGPEYYYYVTATQTDGSGTFNINNPSDFDTTNGVTFALELATGSWNIECGIKKAKTSGTASDDDLPVMSDTYPATVSTANPVVSHTFYPKPGQNGEGKVELKISVYTEISDFDRVTASCSKSAWAEKVSEPVYDTDSGNWIIQTNPSNTLPSGTYEVTFNFYNTSNILLYSTVQIINVFDNMTTNAWLSDGSGAINDEGTFAISGSLVTSFARTTFYVGQTAAATSVEVTASDITGNGSPYAPFETVTKAVEVIAATGNSSKDYRIFVSGTVTGAQEISDAVNGKANSITIAGYNGLDSSGEPKDALSCSGSTDAVTLKVFSTVSVTLKNIKLLGDSTPTSKTMVLVLDNNYATDVTIEEGVWITGNDTSSFTEETFSAVFVGVDGKLTMNGGKISGNKCMSGGGIVVGGTFVMTGGEISGNEATASGGGVHNVGIFTFSGGEVTGNTSSSVGSGINNQGTLNMSGDAFVAGGNDIYLAGEGNKITLTGALTAHSASDQIAITPSEWTRGKAIVQAGGSVTKLTSYKDYFALTDSDWNTNVSSDEKALLLDAPIYVAGQTLSELIECTEVGNDTSGKGTKSAPYATLKKACALLTNSSADYTIFIDGILTGVQEVSGSSLQANSLKIQGTGTDATINGNKGGPALQLTEAINNITILKLNITNGKTGSNGGGILIPDASNGVITKVTLGDGTADNGVGIYENTAVNGGGIYIGLGNELTITNGCKIYNNTAIDEHPPLIAMPCGGGIYSKSTINMSGGEIYGNKIDWNNSILAYGGGLYINANDDESVAFNFSGGRIYGNKARYGGGIYNGAKLFMSGSAVVGNKDKKSLVTETDIENGANFAIIGGGIYNTKYFYIGYTSESQKNTGFSGGIFFNYAQSMGGGVYNDALTDSDLSIVKIAGGSIACNRAESGGAVCQGENSSLEMGDYAYIPQDNACTNDIYLSSDKFITVNSQLKKTEYGWGQAKTVITHASSVSDTKVLDGSSVSDEYKHFSINSDSFYIGSDGLLHAPETKTASTLEELKTIVTSLTEGAGVEIDVTADITCSASWNDPVLKIPEYATLILKSSDSKTIKCSTSANYSADPRLIELDKGAKLVLDGITLAGSSESTNFVRAVHTNSGGAIIMKGSTVIKDFYYSGLGTGLFYLSQGSIFTMQGGTISNCLAGRGGSVAAFWKGIFNFYGGSITGCRSPFYFDVGGLVNWKKSATVYDDYISTSLENNNTKVNIINE